MAGYLPGTRPTSATYADDFVDEKPVEKPDTELPADVFNKMKHDLAYLGRVGFRLIVLVSQSGVVEAVYGPEGVEPSDIVASVNGTDDYSVDWSATGISSLVAIPLSRGSGVQFYTTSLTSTSIVAHPYDPTGGTVIAPLLILVL